MGALLFVLLAFGDGGVRAQVVRPAVIDTVARDGAVDVIVLATDVRAVLLATPPDELTLHREYERLSGFAARVTLTGLRRLARDPRVTAVQLDHLGHPSTAESAVAIGSLAVRQQLGLSGQGVTVAVLDTGVAAGHRDLDGGVVVEKCFVLHGCGPGGEDAGDSAPEGSGHGTHVSGIITGDGVQAPTGIAPGASLVVVRVFDASSLGRVSDWVAALDWILANNDQLRVRIVNMSLGTDFRWEGDCDADQPAMTASIQALQAAGVVVFAASGNEGEPDAMCAPACISTAVSVGASYDAVLGREPDTGGYASGCFDATTDAGQVVCFSNGSEGLDLLAPGARIRAAVPGGVSEKRGTSQATPHASAVSALLLELDPKLTPDELERTLKETGTPIVDPKNGRTTPFLNAQAAVRAVYASYCTRHDGETCRLELPCDAGVAEDGGDGADGGACRTGTCVEGACVITVPSFKALPVARSCSVGVGTAVVFSAVVLRLRRRRPG